MEFSELSPRVRVGCNCAPIVRVAVECSLIRLTLRTNQPVHLSDELKFFLGRRA